METVYNPMMENLRLVLEMNRDKGHSFSKLRVSYAGDSMDVMVLSIIPKWWKIDEQGAYIVTEPPRFIPEIKPKELPLPLSKHIRFNPQPHPGNRGQHERGLREV